MAPKHALSVVLIALMVSGVFFSCLTMGKAESIQKPSASRFAAHYLESSGLITIVIENQPFTPPNNLTKVYYNIAFKWHSVDAWNQLYNINEYTNELVVQSSTGYTDISFLVSKLGEPIGNQVDIQIQAYIAVAHPTTPNGNIGYWTWTESGWSNTQKVTIPEEYLPSGSSTIAERVIGVFAVVGLVIVMLVVSLVLFRKLKRHHRVEAEWHLNRHSALP